MIPEEARQKIKELFKLSLESCMDCEYFHTEDCFDKDGLCTRNNEYVDNIIPIIQAAERKRIIDWLISHNKYPQCQGLVLTVEDFEALKEGKA